jgi:hypothetical protein
MDEAFTSIYVKDYASLTVLGNDEGKRAVEMWFHAKVSRGEPAHAASNVGPLFWKTYTSSVGGTALNSLPRRSSGKNRA